MARMGGGGVSVRLLVFFVILFLIAGAVAWAAFLSKERTDQDLRADEEQVALLKKQFQIAFQEKQQILSYLESAKNAKELETYLGKLDLKSVKLDRRNVKNILAASAVWNFRYSLTVEQLKRDLAEDQALAIINAQARDVNKDAFDKLITDKNQLLSQLDADLRKEVMGKQSVVNRYNQEKTDFLNEHLNELNEFERNKLATLENIKKVSQRTAVLRRDLDYLSPTGTIRKPDGQIIASNWQTQKAVINIGKSNDVFEGLVFNVYSINQQGQPEVKGRVQVMTLRDLTSTCNVIEESRRTPITEGDYVQAPFIPIPESKRFVVVGAFASDAAYTRGQLIDLIKLNGGVVQDKVDLFTDYLIRGETKGVEVGDQSSTALTEEQTAKELSVPVVDYRDFISYIRK